MRCQLVVTAILVLALSLSGVAAPAPAPTPGYRGIALSTSYPAQTVRSGEPASLTLTVKNYGEPPQVVTLRVVESARGWKATLLGGGRPIGAVHVGPDQEVTVTLRLEPPAGARPGTYRFRVAAEGQSGRSDLPLQITLGQVLPPRLSLTAELPVLRGPATSSFKYRLTLKNDSDQDILASLEADVPRGAQISFTPAFGSQQVTSLPVKAGESKDLDAEVTLPRTASAGSYPVTVRTTGGGARAEVKLTLEVTGRPDLSITTPEGRLSGSANAGRDATVKLVVKNTGSAPARDVELSASEPSGWKVTFEPQRIDQIPVNEQREVTATVRPSAKAVAGDYMVTLRANAGDVSTSADFRVTVLTSTLWGIGGIALVAVALAVVGLAVSRYGRR
ncbi:MAG: NEW3 domain-containing protein [Armatimonadota bacterium]|nr:NEW3 domain-containing protein [Armatimonadota bacterium]MDR7531797.1 NEW3 domain-containing protein [Armatimonadota bacterium]MDR7534858.1 NEW3 domain-containing protein [Armatimonadota bacterium]